MAIPKKIIKFLEKNKIKYEIIKHKIVYTAFDKAQTLKVPEKIIGKTLILKIDGELAMVLISADRNLEINKLKKIVQKKKVELASEKLIKNKIKGVKVGAIPPFGNLWKAQTFIDRSLMRQPKIIINGGDYQWSIKIKSSDFKRLIPNLIIGNFSKKRK